MNDKYFLTFKYGLIILFGLLVSSQQEEPITVIVNTIDKIEKIIKKINLLLDCLD